MATPRLDAAYAAQVKATRARVTAFAQARFGAGQYRDADLERFVAEVVPVILSGRRQVSQLTDAWLAAKLTATLGKRVKPRGGIDTDSLRGVDATEVYARPFVTVRTELSNGKALDAAVSIASQRLDKMIASDLQLAKTHTAQDVFSNTPAVQAYERTLTGAKNCALCYVASTQRYYKEDLLPIHPGCDCGVEPIVDTGDRIIYPERLQATHEAIDQRFGTSDVSGREVGINDPKFKDYSKALIVHEHGELGPVIAVRGQHFAGRSVMDH
jgi:hypothetical protein